VTPERLLFAGREPHAALLARYANDIDIGLDPLPYSGGLTTLEALWMGVPVVTLPGATFAGRHAASHVTNAGLPDLVARDAADYVAIIRRLGADRTALAALRAGLRARMRASPLLDTKRFARDLSAALRAAWREKFGA
jgi:predicted O-linked N-acetylglucosamine transferase (SPINDLY family)